MTLGGPARADRDRHQSRLGIDGIDIYELVPLEAQLDRQQTVLQPSEVELGETMQLVCERIERLLPIGW